MVGVKRAYDPASRKDGYRVLVERLWPRGIRKEALALDAWAKDVAPSTALRKWFAHDPERWDEFQRRYHAELQRGPAAEALRTLKEHVASGPVTLVFSSHDATHNSAVALRSEIEHAGAARRRARRPKSKG
jgi:uncharacterized protein YeaO (DUF488 family)